MERRLAAIFAADVAGYSRLMSQDEAGTLRALAAAREIMDGLIADHGGRIANTAGDSVLAEFPSAVDAVQCAVEVQEKLGPEDAEPAHEPTLRFRIGIHVGDVVVRGGDLLGDGVNIAARLQGLAEPGGILLSGAVHSFVRKALSLAYTDLGEQQVKNIDEAIRAYAIRPEARRSRRAPDHMGAPPLARPDKPSIAVLAFTATSPDDEYLGDGIADDVITALSKMRWLFVIARNSTFAYKGAAIEISQIARQLGVAYMLTGNVRRSQSRVRISLQLAEAETGRSLWAERFERELGDVFALQDEIAEQVAGAIEPELLKNEGRRASAARPTNDPSAWALVRRGMWEFHKVSPESHRAARDLFLQAVRLAPEFADGHIWLSRAETGLAAYGWTDDTETTFKEALSEALQGVQLDEQNPYAHYAVAVANVFGGDVGDAEDAAERAVALSPSFALGHLILGAARLYSGRPKEALDAFARGFRLSPFDPQSFTWHFLAALAQYLVGDPDAALREARRCLSLRPRWSSALKVALASHIALNQPDLAASTLRELEHQSDTGGDMLNSFAKHQPGWAAQIETAVASIAEARYPQGSHI